MKKKTALIVEDNVNWANAVEYILSEYFDTVTHYNGESALAWLNEINNVPTLACLDINLHRLSGGKYLSGEDLLTYIITEVRFAKTKILVVTGSGHPTKYVKKNADLVLQKPVTMNQLKNFALKVLENQDLPRGKMHDEY